MSKGRGLWGLSCSALLLAGAGSHLRAQPGTGLDAAVIAEQRELDRRLIEAHDQKDTNKVLSLFSESPEVFFIRPNGILHKGRSNIRKSYDGFFATLDSIRGELQDVSYVPVGDGVIAVGTVIFHRQPKGAPADQRTVVWTDYRRRENGKWVYVFRHAHWPVATGGAGSGASERAAEQ